MENSHACILPHRDHLETLLRDRKLDHTLWGLTPLRYGGQTPSRQTHRWLVPTGIAALDARLEGGLPRGHLSEVIGPRSSGRLAIVVSALAGATLRGEAVALIDPLDMFDPLSASANGIDFQRMLWVRGEPSSSARVSLSCEYGTLQKSLDRAVKALNIVLAGGRIRGGRARFGRGCGAGHQAVAVYDMAATAARHRRQRHGVRVDWQRADCAERRRRHGAVGAGSAQAPGLNARVIRARRVESDQHVRVPLSAAAC